MPNAAWTTVAVFLLAAPGFAAELPPQSASFIEAHCVGCHAPELKKGSLDLTTLRFDLSDAKTFARWVKVYDRVRDGEMPPEKEPRPEAAERTAFLQAVAAPMIEADKHRSAREGRSTLRRLNRYEYENTLRDLLGAPWLQIKDKLPEDGEANRFNKIGDALDFSHVQMARYLGAADYALREVMASQLSPPSSKTTRYYAREDPALVGKMKFSAFNKSPGTRHLPGPGDKRPARCARRQRTGDRGPEGPEGA